MRSEGRVNEASVYKSATTTNAFAYTIFRPIAVQDTVLQWPMDIDNLTLTTPLSVDIIVWVLVISCTAIISYGIFYWLVKCFLS